MNILFVVFLKCIKDRTYNLVLAVIFNEQLLKLYIYILCEIMMAKIFVLFILAQEIAKSSHPNI